jgi:hypothetical protein
MKYPVFFVLAAMVTCLLPRAADARVGEHRNAFERRLFNNGGIIYRDKEERETRRKSGPYTPYLQYLGGSAEVRVYFKSDDGRQPTQADLDKGTLESGWEVHVLYVSGKSVLELYKRIGSMSEYEMNALLAIMGGGGYWKEAEPVLEEEPDPIVEEGESPDEEDEPPPSVFGFEYVRSDGEVRAKKTGGGLMVFQKQLDEYLAKQHEGNLIQSAPKSVQGF